MMEKDDLKQVLAEVLHEVHSMQHEEHGTHHEFVKMCMEREARKREMWEKVKTQVLGWGIIAIVSALGTAVYKSFGGLK